MDAMQMAGHLSLEFGAVVEGPFKGPDDGDQTAQVWLPNKRGVSLWWQAATGDVDLIVIRETVPERGKEYDGTPWRSDFSTPVVNGGMLGATALEGARKALEILRGLPMIDPRDLRNTLPVETREWSAVHYGADRPACGASLREDDTCTTVIKDVRCLDCLEETSRAV